MDLLFKHLFTCKHLYLLEIKHARPPLNSSLKEGLRLISNNPLLSMFQYLLQNVTIWSIQIIKNINLSLQLACKSPV